LPLLTADRKLYLDPVLAPIRRVIPALPLGTVNLDLSPLILLFGLSIIQGIIC